MPKLYYFRAPTFTINPDSPTAPQLGSIFYTLDHLTAPLNQHEIPHLPAEIINPSASLDFHETTGRSTGGFLGLNANILQGIAGTAQVIYSFARDRKNVYQCEMLETIEFSPTNTFVSDAITASASVQNVLANALPGRKRVYMITGLKIATGFSTYTSRAVRHGPGLKIGFDATAFGVPVEAGPEVGLEAGNSRTLSQGRSVNKIVFAYRVARIRVRGDGVAKWKHRDGGSYSVDDDEDSEDEDGWYEVEALDEEFVQEEFPRSVPVEFVMGDPEAGELHFSNQAAMRDSIDVA
ncbi:hypothetical protein BDW02DRAFT_573767 [Decorospora gaudefroyi]|uniref:Uncharacterized protein n=1 Tax=Decorospora gaudefroyi TaxID=184978 RepID=A0A6A5K0T6_9PLEO|nr:hypothetical protein BDW02DRAFT_573767 [Decorospora gaudefroyi]